MLPARTQDIFTGQCVKLFHQLIDFLLTDDRTASVDLGSVDGFQLQVDAGESASSIGMKSDFTPSSSTRLTISFPVNPAVNPSAVLSIPEVSQYDGYVNPFSTGKHQLKVVRFVSPSLKSSTVTI